MPSILRFVKVTIYIYKYQYISLNYHGGNKTWLPSNTKGSGCTIDGKNIQYQYQNAQDQRWIDW